MHAAMDQGQHDERWLLQQLDSRPWRAVVATAFAHTRPDLYALLCDAGPAAAVSLLGVRTGERCLDATGGWGQLAIPLAACARVTVLAPSATRAGILRRIAEQEAVSIEVVVGSPSTGPFSPGAFDLVLAQDLPRAAAAAAGWDGAVAALRGVAALLDAGGRAYLGAANDLALARLMEGSGERAWTPTRYGRVFAEAGLTVDAAYACFPDHERPRYFVPLGLVDDLADGAPPLALREGGEAARLGLPDSGMAAEGIARHFVPSFAFVLRRD